ncbi:MAG TPA: EAL domain-containing protein [Byssovorax sp.]|jgi:EAL domain-containing protein (putative c-di-GMP-specific phosphodiesterase class I)
MNDALPGPRDVGGVRKTRPRVLLVEDDAKVRRMSARVLGAEGFEVVEAVDGRDAFAKMAASTFDVVVSDVSMPRMSGLELLRSIRDRDLEVPVILLTGAPSAAAAAEAKRHGALNYLSKPVDNARLVLTVRRAERLRQLAVAKRAAMDILGSTLPRAGDLTGLEQSLSSALQNLWMAYQPIVRASDRSVYGYEALMRSNEPALPHPGAILDAAERLGRLYDVGRRVRDLAPKALPLASPSALLFVNLHSADLADEAMVDPDSPLVRVAGRVVLELTERAKLDSATVERHVARLREIGFRIAIDDLGAGYAGLTSFALLEPEVVKLDMTLVRNVETTPTKAALVKSVCSVCRDLGALVVAEGIETAGERDCVVDLGCDLLQGYLLARPGEGLPTISWGE